MPRLTSEERKEIISLIEAGKPVPPHLLQKISPEVGQSGDIGKEYSLMYDGKMRREEILANTPAAPWQLVRRFGTDNPHTDKSWHNLLVWGDNLLALRELLADQQGPDKFGTRDKIKLVYIDPPFATKQDFMKDREKAYRDKVLGAKFIEFLRRRLMLLHEVLAGDGSIAVHLDLKKGHYIKSVLDEVFLEENFRNEVVWQKIRTVKAQGNSFGSVHDVIYIYAKSGERYFNQVFTAQDSSYFKKFDKTDPVSKRRYQLVSLVQKGSGPPRHFGKRVLDPGPGRHWIWDQDGIDQAMKEGRIEFTSTGRPRKKQYLDESSERAVVDIWNDIYPINSQAAEDIGYPTQKPESLIERIMLALSRKGDIVLDCFAGSGTTAAVAEKLGRRWIAIDSGKLAIYTMQKRLSTMRNIVGPGRNDDSLEPERITDWEEHIKNDPGIFLISEKARKGECNVTIELLEDLSELIRNHGLLKKDASFSIVCPEEKLLIPKKSLVEVEEGPGEWSLKVKGVEYRISSIEKKEKRESEKPLKPREFALYRAGLYDMTAVRQMSWGEYKPFVLKLFGVREHNETRYGVHLDGYVGPDSAIVWNYPDYKNLTLDHGYVESLHSMLRGKKGERFYIIAPVVSMAFPEDEVVLDGVTYVFLKVPLSILMRLIEKHEPAALKQPTKEEDVNEVIDAVGFDFISQPIVKAEANVQERKGELFSDYVIELKEFRSQTLATDPEDFANFETFSMAMVDCDYDGKIFKLDRVFWADDLTKEAGGLEEAKKLSLRIPKETFKGSQMMVIFCDRYGNEKSLLFRKSEFTSENKVKTNRRPKGRSRR